jgi:hypothetical protein
MDIQEYDKRLRNFLAARGAQNPSGEEIERLRRWARRTTWAGLVAFALCTLIAYLFYSRYGGLAVIPVAVIAAVVYGALYLLSRRWGARRKR